VDLLFLGHRNPTITIALLALFLGVTKNTARPEPGGTELTRNADQAQRRPESYVRSKVKGKALGPCPSVIPRPFRRLLSPVLLGSAENRAFCRSGPRRRQQYRPPD